MVKVAALYIDPRGPYPKLLGPDLGWDETRDARTYDLTHSVVAHPPCGPWGRLKHLSRREEDRELFPHALEMVRRLGGVLEHPAFSTAFPVFGIPFPDDPSDEWGGYTISINQCDFGHVARKSTWLYIVGAKCGVLPAPREPTYWVSGWHHRKDKGGGKTPPHIKICSAARRVRTPVEFARWLIEVASRARPYRRVMNQKT